MNYSHWRINRKFYGLDDVSNILYDASPLSFLPLKQAAAALLMPCTFFADTNNNNSLKRVH